MSLPRGHKPGCTGSCWKLPGEPGSVRMLDLDGLPLELLENKNKQIKTNVVLGLYTCGSSQGKGIGVHGDVLCQGKGTYVPGAEKALSSTDLEGAVSLQDPHLQSH